MDLYLELMRDVYSLKKDGLVAFAQNIGMLDVNLTGTMRTISKAVREHIDTMLQGGADETAEITKFDIEEGNKLHPLRSSQYLLADIDSVVNTDTVEVLSITDSELESFNF